MASTSPTTNNGRTVAGMYEAFGRGDVPYVLAQMAPDVEWIETEARNIPTHGTFASPQEVLENVFAKVPEHFEQFELRPELWIEAGDDVVVTGRVVARTHTGRKLDAPTPTCSPSGTERSAATTTSTTRHCGQPHCLEPSAGKLHPGRRRQIL